MRFDVRDWYWTIGNDATHVWGSASQTLVDLADTDYIDWLAVHPDNQVNKIDSYASLYDVLKNRAPDIAAVLVAGWISDDKLHPQQAFENLLAAGCHVESIGTPAINATYAIDVASQLNVIAIALGIAAGKGFPADADTYDYPDITGTLITFDTTTLFLDFAVGVRDYVAALANTLIVLKAGGSSAWPTLPVTIA